MVQQKNEPVLTQGVEKIREGKPADKLQHGPGPDIGLSRFQVQDRMNERIVKGHDPE